jgi:HK97 family phage major capsid protein
MQNVSIDALRQRKVEIESKIEPLIAANQVILDKAHAESRDFSVDETSTFNKNMEALKPLKASMKAYDAQLGEVAEKLDRERNSTSGKSVTDNDTEAKAKAKRNLGFKSLGDQLKAVVDAGRTGRPDPRLMGKFGDFDAQGNFRAAGGSDGSMNEAVPSEGGFLVGGDYSDKIYQRTYLTGEITRRCTKQPISASSNRLVLRVVDEDSRADGSRMGGVIAFWQNEADTFLSSRPKFRRIELVLNKLTAVVFATDELLEDAAALEAWIMSNLPTEINFRVEDAIFQGTGVGMPQGIMNSQALIKLSPGSSPTVVNTTDVLAMWAQFWHPGLANSIAAYSSENLTPGGNVGQIPSAAWFIDQTVIPQLFALQLGSGTASILLYHPPGYQGLAGPYGQLLGIPVIPTEHNNALGTAGDILLADASQILLADKGSVQAAASMHVRFLQDEMTFRFTYRVDAQTTWKKPLTPKSGGSVLSPFVALASGSSR